MDMSNSIMIAAPRTRVWDALNDPATLQRCIAGCESIEVTGDNAYKVAMTVAIGPVKAKFKGELMLEDIDAPNAYTIRFSGQGGMAGFGKGSARVTLSDAATGDISRDLAADGAGQGPHDAAAMQEGTRLDYTVDAQIGGKIAQVGSRLIDGASKKMADDFFKAFRREVEVPLPEKEISSATTAAPSPPLPTPAPSPPLRHRLRHRRLRHRPRHRPQHRRRHPSRHRRPGRLQLARLTLTPTRPGSKPRPRPSRPSPT